jgi:O-antigen/teichoic acid export membrane protein
VTSSLVAPALARNDAPGLSEAIQRQTRWLAYGAFPLAGLFIGFGDPLLRVFGHEFNQGASALAVLAVGHTVNALALASFALPLSGHARYTTYVAGATLIAQSALAFAVVPRFGPLGAAIALSGGLIVAQTAQLLLAARVVGVRGVPRDLFVLLACTLVALCVGRVSYEAVDASVATRFIVGVATSAVVYAVSSWTFAITSLDRLLAMRWLRIRDN